MLKGTDMNVFLYIHAHFDTHDSKMSLNSVVEWKFYGGQAGLSAIMASIAATRLGKKNPGMNPEPKNSLHPVIIWLTCKDQNNFLMKALSRDKQKTPSVLPSGTTGLAKPPSCLFWRTLVTDWCEDFVRPCEDFVYPRLFRLWDLSCHGFFFWLGFVSLIIGCL